MGKKKGRRRKRKTHQVDTTQTNTGPQTFVIKMGRRLPDVMKELKSNVKMMMKPNTAYNLKERRSNVLKDFVAVASNLGVTHMLIFSNTDLASYLRIGKLPRGPTLTFRILSFSTMRDVASMQKKPVSPGKEFNTPPLVVLNNFPNNEEMPKLMAVMFQKLFPPINVQTVRLEDCKRVVLFSYNKQLRQVEIRHYLITLKATGVSKSVKRVISAQIPDLSKFQDISDYVLKENYFSDSEGEDTPESRVTLPNQGTTPQQSVRLKEIGPRMDLQLIKVQKDFCDGDVVFHEYVKKTPEEIKELERKKQERERLKKERRAKQEENIKRKQALREQGQEVSSDEEEGSELEEEDWEEDLKWYREEVGEEPNVSELKKMTVGEKRKEKFNPLYRKKGKDNTSTEKSKKDEMEEEEGDNQKPQNKPPPYRPKKRKQEFKNKLQPKRMKH